MTSIHFGSAVLVAVLWAASVNAEPVLIRHLHAQSGLIVPDLEGEFLVNFRLASPDFSLGLQALLPLGERWLGRVQDGLGDLSVSRTVPVFGGLFLGNTITSLDGGTLQFSIETSPSPIAAFPSSTLVNVTKFTFSGTLSHPSHPQTYELAGSGDGQLRLNNPFGEPVTDGTYAIRDPSFLRFTSPAAEPIPEPSTLLLMTGAGLAVGMCGRLRQRRS